MPKPKEMPKAVEPVQAKPPILKGPAAGPKIPKFKSWGEQEKFFMKHPKLRK